MVSTEDPIVGVRFVVEIDDVNLGAFASCEGLGCEVTLEPREEGGNNGFTWQLPTRISYPNITLTRPLGTDTRKISQWITSAVHGGARKTAHISAMTATGTVVARWGLLDVVPVRWQGPSFSPDGGAVLTESIEIAHHGFVDA